MERQRGGRGEIEESGLYMYFKVKCELCTNNVLKMSSYINNFATCTLCSSTNCHLVAELEASWLKATIATTFISLT